ncbi:DUF6353 family protein [Lachnospiraceae bacterium 29-84]
MNTKMTENAKRTLYKMGLSMKKHSPEVLAVMGVIGAVAGAVMACRATTKISGILDEAKETIDTIHECQENPEMEEKYTEEDGKKDLAIVYARTGKELAKLYAPSIIVGTCSIVCLLASNNILRKRNAALTAAYAAVDRSFREYRSRVAGRFGTEVEHELKHNIKVKEIMETVLDENGKEKTEKKTVGVMESNEPSEFARFFNESCGGWSKDPEYNLMFLRAEQNYANDRLKARGYLFLNEIYDRLGIPPTKAGQIVGWVYNPENPVGDNYVDFGIYDVYKERNQDFVNGYERNILLDFNVDGNILELI